MKRRPMCVAFATLLLVLGATTAGVSARASGFAPVCEFTTPAPGVLPGLGAPALPVASPGLDGSLLASHFEPRRAGPPDAEVSASRYQPRLPPGHPPIGGPVGPPVPPAQSRYQPRVSNPPVKKPYPKSGGQIHGGVLGRRDGSSLTDPAFLLGFRGGSQITPVLQLGLGVDWRHKSGTSTEVLQTSTGPGGEQIVLHRDFSHYSSDLVPAMVYLQFSIPMGFVPYAGAGAGWQVLFLSADDYQTGNTIDATYHGFGWQAWGGIGVPLGNQMRMFGEAFFNDADLNRNVYDYDVDASYRETIHDEGVGVRGGLSFGF